MQGRALDPARRSLLVRSVPSRSSLDLLAHWRALERDNDDNHSARRLSSTLCIRPKRFTGCSLDFLVNPRTVLLIC